MKLSEADIESFSEEQENVNTKNRTLYDHDFKLFKEFRTSEDERRELQEIPTAKVQQFSKTFVLGVRN